MRNVLRAVIAFGSLAACGGHHHGYYEAPPPLEYRHYHRLDCNHLVQCRYFGGAHHFTPHRRHDRYWARTPNRARALPAVLRRAEAA